MVLRRPCNNHLAVLTLQSQRFSVDLAGDLCQKLRMLDYSGPEVLGIPGYSSYTQGLPGHTRVLGGLHRCAWQSLRRNVMTKIKSGLAAYKASTLTPVLPLLALLDVL